MKEDWLSEQEDLRRADKIIKRHTETNDGKPLPMVEVLDGGQGLELRIPDWILEIMQFFADQYGIEQGNQVAARVLTHYLLEGETIH